MTLPIINPRVEIAGRPILFECLVSLGPPELLRNFEIIAGLVVHDEPLRARRIMPLCARLQIVIRTMYSLLNTGLRSRAASTAVIHSSLLSTFSARAKPAPLTNPISTSRSTPSNRCLKTAAYCA
jgi:hypothetical protein